MLEVILHFSIILAYFLVLIPVAIVFVTKNELRISNYFKKPWTILIIVFSGVLVFLLTKYLSFAFALLFLHVIGFWCAWYYWRVRGRHWSQNKK